jgi:steroid delta-isomerase-like uncharacterized protein
MSEENKRVSRRLVEEAFRGGRLEVVDELVDQSYEGHDPGSPDVIRGPEGVKQLIQGYRTAFPDLDIRIEDQLAEGDKVASRWSARGTHQGELFGVPPTGKESRVTGITIDRISGGKIVESHDNWDTLGLLQQLGAIPAQAQAEARI